MKMSNEEAPEYRQKSELELLKSMYERDLKDLRLKRKGDKWHPLDIILNLKPLRGSSDYQVPYVTVDLHIECTEEYPNEPPTINLENPRGMSNVTVSELKNDLILLAAERTGEVMIYELASYVEEFLHKHNKAPKGSFYDEMVTRNRTRERVEREKEELEIARRNQDIMDEVQQRQEILKLETKKRKEQRLSSENSNDSGDSRKRSVSGNRWFNTSFDLSDELICEHKSTTILEFSNNAFKEIERGCCINHSKRNCIVYSGMDRDTGQLFMIHEWMMPINSDITLIQRQISSIEQELNYLVKHRHQNLVHYLNIRQDIVQKENKFVVQILQEFVFGLSCDSLFLYENIPLELDMLRHIAKGVLNALEFLHRNKIVHKDLTSSCIYLNNKGIVKVSNYSLDKRLFDLVTQTHSSNYNRQTDIYKFGILILSLIKGSEVDDSNLDIPSNLSLDLQDFLDRCLAKDEKDRLPACQLLNHQFLKIPVRLSPQRNAEEKPFERNPSPDTQAADKMLEQTNLGGQSRVENEFERLNCLGKGAYGVVFKVQNKLDQRYYALKRIELNPKNKQLNRKIIREVKLLSRLNHENVVRYYYSWIESAVIKIDDNECSTPSVTPSTAPNKKEVLFNDASMIEKLAPPIRDVEWSISYGNKSKGVKNKSSSEDESSSDDDEDNWGLRFKSSSESSDSDYIEFERDNQLEASKTIDITESKTTDTVDSKISLTKQIQFMYIQMEFCEKSTLKTVIDHDIYRDSDRVWRLFREIVEGLAYIHLQGMIHRDLKPMNIFLDSDDHVKIGDFGLATTNLFLRPNDFQTGSKSYTDYGSHEGGGDPSMTGHIGTALYVAPELTSTAKAVYNQKVDIYSLGIIFFEMSYKPLSTGMERIGVLNRLRSEESVFPPDFRESASANQEHVIRWLLNHNVSKRPTCQELLQSDSLPPPVYEDRELQELVRRTLNNPQLKGYKYLVESCFQQSISPAQDITYDNELTAANTVKNLQIYNCVKEAIIKVFYIHGGQNLSTPLLMPSSKFYDGVDTCVKLMTHSGSIVSIPHDLRVPFARYIAWNGITSFRRFAIERVYREKKIFGFVPRELYECAFDIVTPIPGNFMADAELLHILNEVVEQIPGFKNCNLQIRLNHALLLQAIMLHCGIKDKHSELCHLLSDAREGKITRSQVRTHLISNGLSDNHITTLFNLLECENTITKIVGVLQTVTKNKNTKASQLAKQALQELKIIIQNAEALGVNFNIVITPGLVYNIQQYSGMMCQLVCEVKKKHKRGMEVLAAGGRYDNMICSYRKMMVQANKSSVDAKQSAVGISISLDKLVQAVDKEQIPEIATISYLDVVVCSLGSSTLIKEKSKVLHELWSASIRCCLIDAVSLEDIQQQCNESHISHAVILKEHGVVKVVSWDRDRLQETQLRTVELVDHLQRILRTSNDSCSEVNNVLSRSDSKVSRDSQEAYVTISFSEKLTVNNRKRFETQIRAQLDCVFKRLNGDVTLLAINLEGAVLSTMATCLDFETEGDFNKSVEVVKEGHQKHKKHLSEICEDIYVKKMKKNQPIIILYSLKDSVYKVLL